MAYSLPQGWASDYDGASERWFFVHRPSGVTQSHFPKAGDELVKPVQPVEMAQPQPKPPVAMDVLSGKIDAMTINVDQQRGTPAPDPSLQPHQFTPQYQSFQAPGQILPLGGQHLQGQQADPNIQQSFNPPQTILSSYPTPLYSQQQNVTAQQLPGPPPPQPQTQYAAYQSQQYPPTQPNPVNNQPQSPAINGAQQYLPYSAKPQANQVIRRKPTGAGQHPRKSISGEVVANSPSPQSLVYQVQEQNWQPQPLGTSQMNAMQGQAANQQFTSQQVQTQSDATGDRRQSGQYQQQDVSVPVNQQYQNQPSAGQHYNEQQAGEVARQRQDSVASQYQTYSPNTQYQSPPAQNIAQQNAPSNVLEHQNSAGIQSQNYGQQYPQPPQNSISLQNQNQASPQGSSPQIRHGSVGHTSPGPPDTQYNQQSGQPRQPRLPQGPPPGHLQGPTSQTPQQSSSALENSQESVGTTNPALQQSSESLVHHPNQPPTQEGFPHGQVHSPPAQTASSQDQQTNVGIQNNNPATPDNRRFSTVSASSRPMSTYSPINTPSPSQHSFYPPPPPLTGSQHAQSIGQQSMPAQHPASPENVHSQFTSLPPQNGQPQVMPPPTHNIQTGQLPASPPNLQSHFTPPPPQNLQASQNLPGPPGQPQFMPPPPQHSHTIHNSGSPQAILPQAQSPPPTSQIFQHDGTQNQNIPQTSHSQYMTSPPAPSFSQGQNPASPQNIQPQFLPPPPPPPQNVQSQPQSPHPPAPSPLQGHQAAHLYRAQSGPASSTFAQLVQQDYVNANSGQPQLPQHGQYVPQSAGTQSQQPIQGYNPSALGVVAGPTGPDPNRVQSFQAQFAGPPPNPDSLPAMGSTRPGIATRWSTTALTSSKKGLEKSKAWIKKNPMGTIAMAGGLGVVAEACGVPVLTDAAIAGRAYNAHQANKMKAERLQAQLAAGKAGVNGAEKAPGGQQGMSQAAMQAAIQQGIQDGIKQAMLAQQGILPQGQAQAGMGRGIPMQGQQMQAGRGRGMPGQQINPQFQQAQVNFGQLPQQGRPQSQYIVQGGQNPAQQYQAQAIAQQIIMQQQQGQPIQYIQQPASQQVIYQQSPQPQIIQAQQDPSMISQIAGMLPQQQAQQQPQIQYIQTPPPVQTQSQFQDPSLISQIAGLVPQQQSQSQYTTTPFAPPPSQDGAKALDPSLFGSQATGSGTTTDYSYSAGSGGGYDPTANYTDMSATLAAIQAQQAAAVQAAFQAQTDQNILSLWDAPGTTTTTTTTYDVNSYVGGDSTIGTGESAAATQARLDMQLQGEANAMSLIDDTQYKVNSSGDIVSSNGGWQADYGGDATAARIDMETHGQANALSLIDDTQYEVSYGGADDGTYGLI